jgi:hypothetical protein
VIRRKIDTGMMGAMMAGAESGSGALSSTVVAYTLLQRGVTTELERAVICHGGSAVGGQCDLQI